ncbi:ABC transporter ATP-binding protein [Candidatus Mycoplasma mahonii]|uniref:ABC transporter ATP-binding protein n=1 Tax=Candidatus Mycoplasma mahonii TaxID=3004105 RepID=UPI0026F24075|nr:ABC transporter ATP-binding protein [Candidatus Mycoplasma mahonii]WKX02232.1 ABC transporter ATP-binding protein [Candidatus Mycoplasma mahonii]
MKRAHKKVQKVEIRNENLSNIAIDVKGFSKMYRGNNNYAVRNASFQVKKGEFHGFIGANGAGKTTTIKSLIGAYANFSGKITIFGQKHTSLSAKKRMGYIPEMATFPKTLNTLQYITQMAHLAGISLKESKKYAIDALSDIGLSAIMRRKPSTFSSGQKKKVLLAQALVNKPDVIIMDEPAANLDPQARSEFFHTLKALQKREVAIFISSHILSELDQFIDSVTIIDGGSIVYSGTKANLTQGDNLSFVVVPESPKDNIKLEKIAKLLKLETKTVTNGEGIIIDVKNDIQQWTIMKNIIKEKIKLKKFASNVMTLQESYDFYVKKGSVDTQPKNLNVERGSE